MRAGGGLPSRVRFDALSVYYGGRFDPPHLGHQEVVQDLFTSLGVARIFILPSGSPSYKPCHASPEHRIEMAKLCFLEDTSAGPVTLDLREIERQRKNPSLPTYTFDTLTELKNLPNKAFVIGVDQLAAFPTWHRYLELLGLSHWIVVKRKDRSEADARKILAEWELQGLIRQSKDVSPRVEAIFETKNGTTLNLVPTRAPALSSTEIRQELGKTGKICAGKLPPLVETYLRKHRLYGMASTTEV